MFLSCMEKNVLCVVVGYFYFWRTCHPASNKSWRLFLTFECSTLDWMFLASFLNLNYPIYHMPLCVYLYLFYMPLFLAYSVTGCVTGWLAVGAFCSSFSGSSLFLFFSYLVSFSAIPAYFSLLPSCWAFISLLD